MSAAADREARMALSCVVDCGEPAVCELALVSGAEVAWAKARSGGFGPAVARRASTLDLPVLRRQAELARIRFVVPDDEEWPAQLGDLQYAGPVNRRGGVPVGLWLRGPGNLAELCRRSVAVVGSRASSNYGSGVAADLGADLVDQGVTVVSGGAFGVDAAAHRGALSVHGPTVSVLANGVDVPYPFGNAALLTWIAQEHVLVSELPPGATPTRVRFLIRTWAAVEFTVVGLGRFTVDGVRGSPEASRRVSQHAISAVDRSAVGVGLQWGHGRLSGWAGAGQAARLVRRCCRCWGVRGGGRGRSGGGK